MPAPAYRVAVDDNRRLEIELDTDGQKSWIVIHAHRRRKLKVLAGHPLPTLGWLAVLLRAATGLEGRDAADHANA